MFDLVVELDVNSKIPLYEQIYQFIKEEIKNGRITSKTKLPSTRALSEHLEVSRSTIDMAYSQLVSEGYIESKPYRGYFVSEISLLYDIKNKSDYKVYKEKSEKEEDLIDFSPRGIDLENFPFNSWRKISRGLLSADNKNLFDNCDIQGEWALRETICTYLYEARGVHSRPDNIILGAGNEILLMMLNRLFGEKCCIAMENPTYISAYNVFKQNGNTVIPISMDKSGISISELRECEAKIAYVMPSHQFPTGIVMPIRRRIELLEWTNEDDERYIIEDDYDSEFRYQGKPIPALQGLDTKGKVIYLGTFSKSIAPSIRMSYMVLPDELLYILRNSKMFYSQTVSKMDQMIVNEFIKDGYFERHLNKMRSIYRAKHDLIITLLKEYKDKVTIYGENSGLHIMIKVNNSMTEEKLITKAKEAGVSVYGLSDYYIERKTNIKSTLLVGFAKLSMEEIEEGIKKLVKVWRL